MQNFYANVDCVDKQYESGRGQPHSKTLARCSKRLDRPQGFGVRLSSAAFFRIAKLCRSAVALIAVLVLISGCRTSSHKTSAAKTVEPPAAYVRTSNTESNLLELQIAARRFVPARGKGPTVWLTGVSHLGTSNYFAALQQHLNAQTLVLFEGVGEHSQDFKNRKQESSHAIGNDDATAKTAGTGLQSSLATSLGLVFQLDTIDYDRPNFRHSDLSIREIRELLAEPRGSGGGDAADDFDNLMSMMQGDSFMNIVMQFGLGILASSPRLQAMSKVTLIELIAEMGGDPSRLGAISPQLKQLLEVLIARRNQRVIDDLKIALKEVGRKGSVSVFYGTGHMNEMETRLRKELNYRPVEDVWFSAITVNLAEAGISAGELEFIRGFIQTQMKPLSGQ